MLFTDSHYEDHIALLEDLAVVVNLHVCGLAAAGCRYIQVDEPLLMRKPDDALNFGLDILTKCFKVGIVPECLLRALSMCLTPRMWLILFA